VPAAGLESLGVNKSLIAGGLMQDRPMAIGISESPLGRSATILLPRFDEEVDDDPSGLAEEIADAIGLAKSMGARAVALASPLTAAIDAGLALPASATENMTLVDARSMMAAAIVENIAGVLKRAGRTLARETVAFDGLDLLGMAAIRLLLSTQPHPESILLSDQPEGGSNVDSFQREMREGLGFMGRLAVAGATPSLYEATLIVSLGEAKRPLDVVRLRAGTIVVDACFPRGFQTSKALERMHERNDVLFTEGGLLESAQPFQKMAFVPEVAESFRDNLVGRFSRRDPRLTTAAMVAALFAAEDSSSTPALGTLSLESTVRDLERLRRSGFTAPPPQLDDVATPEEVVAEFRKRFNDAERTTEGTFAEAGWTRLTASQTSNGHGERRAAEVASPTND
jgi:hypothetical protein